MTLTPRAQRIALLSLAAITLALTGLWAAGVVSKPNEAQRDLVPESTMWGMHACVVAAVAGLASVVRPVANLLGRKRLLTALSVFGFGVLVCQLAPKTYRIFFDEHIYMQIGQTIAHTGRAEGANYARAEYGKFEMYSPWVNKQPNGLPYLLSWLYRVAGVSASVSHWLNPLLTGLAASALYLALTLVPWRLPSGAAPAAGALFCLTPLAPWWAGTVAVEPAAAAIVVFAFLAACLHSRLRDATTAQGRFGSGLLLAATTAFAIYFRPESMLVFALVTLVLWASDDRFIEDLSAWFALLLAVALALPNLLHLWSMRTEDWGATDGRRLSFDFVSKNFQSNGGYFFNSEWFPVAGTLLMAAGLLWLLLRNRTAGFALGLWFALSWGIFILFYAGGYHYGASSRYAVISAAPIAIFMGIGFAWVCGALRRSPPILAGLLALLAINWISAMAYVPTVGREAAEALADVRFIERVAPTLPEGSLVVSPDPCVWLMEGVNSTQFFTVETMLEGELRELVNQYPGGIYVHWSYWHNAEPKLAEYTAKLLAKTEAETFTRMDTQAYKLAILRIDTPTGLERNGGRVPEQPFRRNETDLEATVERARAALESAKPAPVP